MLRLAAAVRSRLGTRSAPVAERHVRERNVDGVDRLPPALVDRRRNTDPDCADVFLLEALDGLFDLRQNGVLATRVGRADNALLDDTFIVDDPREQLRAPEVKSDHTGGSHGLRLRYSVACRPRTSRTASTAGGE